MISPRRTLTTIGLSIRDELRVKSLLQIVEGKTAAPWIYIEEVQADLALCEPESALARVVIEQSASNRPRRCVMLLRQGAECPPGITSVFSPLGVRELIALLDGVTGAHPAEENHSLQPPRPAAVASNASLLESLRQITTSQADGRSHHISIGETSLWVLPNQTVVLSNAALTAEHVATLANGRDVAVEAFAHLEPNVADTHVHRCPLPVLLWNCAMAADTAGRGSSPNSTYSLKRWPDFGRFPHSQWHLRLTALMIREAFSAQQMSVLIEQPVAKIEAFLHACDAIGLLVTNLASESRSADSTAPQATDRAEKPGRWFSIFQSFRQALNIGSGRG